MIDLFSIAIYAFYYYLRLEWHDDYVMPHIHSDGRKTHTTPTQGVIYIILHTVILFLMTLKALYYIQIFSNYSKLVTLIRKCLVDIVPFMVFYLGMLCMSSLFYINSGIIIGDDKDFEHVLDR